MTKSKQDKIHPEVDKTKYIKFKIMTEYIKIKIKRLGVIVPFLPCSLQFPPKVVTPTHLPSYLFVQAHVLDNDESIFVSYLDLLIL